MQPVNFNFLTFANQQSSPFTRSIQRQIPHVVSQRLPCHSNLYYVFDLCFFPVPSGFSWEKTFHSYIASSSTYIGTVTFGRKPCSLYSLHYLHLSIPNFQPPNIIKQFGLPPILRCSLWVWKEHPDPPLHHLSIAKFRAQALLMVFAPVSMSVLPCFAAQKPIVWNFEICNWKSKSDRWLLPVMRWILESWFDLLRLIPMLSVGWEASPFYSWSCYMS